ncbi:FHA domain-containing protein [Synechococcus sp. PCC 7336]|uniref:FHA domain-containing protein n=1 Tax=Synechococcus sp. PCC 7336 TaxID=195250 RepID=UPI00034994F5|nr:FHA domain-containing protein [Synechococcus sp. PCC 7336]
MNTRQDTQVQEQLRELTQAAETSEPDRLILSASDESSGGDFDLVSKKFLEYFLNYPVIENLKKADLLSDRDIEKLACEWRRMGGKLDHILLDRMGFKSATVDFFRDSGELAKGRGCKRLGEFLRAAGLVSEEEIKFALQQVRSQNRRLKIGEALVEYGLIKQSTVEYFADEFVDSQSREERLSGHQDALYADDLDVDGKFHQSEFMLVFNRNEVFSSVSLKSRMYSVGRDSKVDILIDDKCVSRRHAYLIRSSQGDIRQSETYEVLDCGRDKKYSKHGVFVNGKKVRHRVLRYGDVIGFGPNIRARFLPREMAEVEMSAL